MKRILSLILLFGIIFTACQSKSDPQNDQGLENKPDTNLTSEPKRDPRFDSAKAASTVEYIYKSDNGEMVDVSFFEVYGEKYIEVKREGKDAIILDKVKASANRAIYEKNIYKWVGLNGTATFSNGISFLNLSLVSPLIHIYTNGEEEITITYFLKGDKRFVTIQKDSLPGITLEQTAAWAKGAEYGKGSVQWRSQSNTGILIQDGVRTEFKEKQ